MAQAMPELDGSRWGIVDRTISVAFIRSLREFECLLRVCGSHSRHPSKSAQIYDSAIGRRVVKGCWTPAPKRKHIKLHKNSTGRRLTGLKGGNRGNTRCG